MGFRDFQTLGCLGLRVSKSGWEWCRPRPEEQFESGEKRAGKHLLRGDGEGSLMQAGLGWARCQVGLQLWVQWRKHALSSCCLLEVSGF